MQEGSDLLEKLYFGSVPVYFAKVPGEAHAYTAESFIETNDDPALRQVSLDRTKPAAFLGEDYSNLILPAIAAIDLKDVSICFLYHKLIKIRGPSLKIIWHYLLFSVNLSSK